MEHTLEQMVNAVAVEYRRRIVTENSQRHIRDVACACFPDLLCLGSGAWGAVFLHPDDDNKVIRLSSSAQFDMWFHTAKFGMETQNNCFSKVYEIYLGGIFGAAIVERLYSGEESYFRVLCDRLTSRLREECDVELAVREFISAPYGFKMEHIQALRDLSRHLTSRKIKFAWDTYSRNFMRRKNGELVLTDPIS